MTDVSIPAATLAASVSLGDGSSAAPSSSQRSVFSGAESPFAKVLMGMGALPTLGTGESVGGVLADRQRLAEHGKTLPEAVSFATAPQQIPVVSSGSAAPSRVPDVTPTPAAPFTPLPDALIRGTHEPQAAIRPAQVSVETLVAAEQENGVQVTQGANAKVRVALHDEQIAAAFHDTDTARGVTASGLSLNSGSQPIPSSDPPPPVTRLVLPSTPDSPSWQEGFSTRLSWMVKEGIQLAELRIRPPEMGLIEVRIAVSQQEASIAFAAQHGAVRDAIESALPRLREMLSDGGISLGNVDVSEHTQGRESHAPWTRFEGTDDWQDPRSSETEAVPISEHTLLHHGLVDRYA